MENKERALEAGLLELRRLTSTDFAALALHDESSNRVRFVSASGSRNDRYKRIVMRIGKGIAGTVVRSGRPLVIESFRLQKADDPSDYPILLAEGLHAVAACPLVAQERVFGALLIGNRFDHAFSSVALQMLKDAAEQFGTIFRSRSSSN